MDEIIKDFLVESSENLDRLDQELVQLESDPSSGDLLSSIFRTIHTIKGSCGFLGFAKLEKVAHAGENLLSRMRDGRLTLNAEITSELLTLVDAIRQMLAEIRATEQDGSEEYPALIENLKRLQQAAPADAAKTTAPASSAPQTAAAPRTAPKSAPMEAQPASAPVAPPAPPAEAPGSQDAALRRRPKADRLGGLLVNRGHARAEDIALALQEQEKGDRRRLGEILVALGLVRPEDVRAALQISGDTRSREVKEQTIRVDVTRLDKLMNLAGELVLARNRITQFSIRQGETGFVSMAQQLNLLTSELQEEVMRTRMQPISNLFDKFPRIVRDLATACGKQIQIVMEGKETELDKSLLEAIKDPLTHIVRNSVDHGLEMPEERTAKGKKAEGRLLLRAYHEGGTVIIEISDDGAGIDKARVKDKALAQGLINAQQAARMSDRELLGLVFLPGLSTAQKVTNISGRGVGMDVVKTNIERVNGSVELESAPQKGTTVKIKIPLTLAIVPALIVQSGGRRFAIPQVSLVELVRLESGRAQGGIELVHGAPVYRLRGRLLPLVYLDRELGLVPPGAVSHLDEAINILVLQADSRQFGLVVDVITDTEEIVVKPLSKHLKRIGTYAGATIMGDGKVALILDVLGLAKSASIVSEVRDSSLTAKAADEHQLSADQQTFLLFAGPGGSRMALPLDTLARLEEIPSARVERSGLQWVAQYRGEILPLILITDVLEERRPLEVSPFPGAGTNQVLVLNHAGQRFGLVVDQILDIVEDRADVKSPATRSGVLYSAVIAGRVTELLDIPAILSAAVNSNPNSGPAPELQAGAGQSQAMNA